MCIVQIKLVAQRGQMSTTGTWLRLHAYQILLLVQRLVVEFKISNIKLYHLLGEREREGEGELVISASLSCMCCVLWGTYIVLRLAMASRVNAQ